MATASTAPARAALSSPSTSTAAPVIRTGNICLRERTAFGGRTWKSKGVVLDETILTIHQPSTRHIHLPLNSITELERTDLKPHSLSVKCGSKTYHLAFDTDGDLYDWRDDIYNRCPLGAQATNPFNFQHTAHIGANGASGTFTEPHTLPLYEDLMGRSTSAKAAAQSSKTATATLAPTLTSRTRSSQSVAGRRRSNPLKGHIILNNNNNVNIEGVYFVKQTGMFAGWYWKERWLSLKGSSLTVHTRKTKTSPPAKEIPLSSITSVEPDPKRSNCLFIATTRRETCLYVLFDTDSDLYAWRETIYLRSGLSNDIGSPTDFVHAMHVTYDEATGELKGLPDQWKTILDPALFKLSTPTHVKLPGNPNNNNNVRSPRRRSHPPRTEVLDGTGVPSHSHVGRIASSADTHAGHILDPRSVAGSPGSPSSQFLAGTSISSEGTLVNVSGTPVLMSVLKGNTAGLGG